MSKDNRTKFISIALIIVSLAVIAPIVYYICVNTYKRYEIKKAKSIQREYAEDFTKDEDKKYSNNEYYQLAAKAYREKDYINAQACLKSEIRQFSQHAQAWFLLGKTHEEYKTKNGKMFAEMVSKYNKYLELKPNGKRVEYVKLKLAQYYIRDGVVKKDYRSDYLLNTAKEYLLSLKQHNGLVRMSLGAIYMHYEQYEQAIREFENAFSLSEQDMKLKYNSLGLALIKTKEWEKAVKYLEMAVSLDPGNKYSHYMLGFAFMHQDDLKNAERCYKASLKLDPKYKHARSNLRRVEKALRTQKR